MIIWSTNGLLQHLNVSRLVQDRSKALHGPVLSHAKCAVLTWGFWPIQITPKCSKSTHFHWFCEVKRNGERRWWTCCANLWSNHDKEILFVKLHRSNTCSASHDIEKVPHSLCLRDFFICRMFVDSLVDTKFVQHRSTFMLLAWKVWWMHWIWSKPKPFQSP